MNDKDREDWINNDEDLYRWMRDETRVSSFRGGMREFIRQNRTAIDAHIRERLNQKPR